MAWKLRRSKESTWTFAFFIIIFALLLVGCYQMILLDRKDNDLTINDIAYDVNKKLGYTIYLIENESYVPYLVLTNDYDGNVLLLRKYLLDGMKPYNNQGTVPSYYEESEMDHFLNDEFFNSLSNVVRDKITDSEVMITDIDSIGRVGTDTLIIQRKVFILSYTETAQEESLVNAVEGISLKYFMNNLEALCAQTTSGEAGSWGLRTPNTAYFNAVYGISPDGYVGVCSVGGTEGTYENGVRPAFCLPKNIAIIQSNVDGKDVYIISGL